MSAISRQIFAGAATGGGTSPLLHRRVVVPPITRRSVTVQSDNSPISLVLRCPTRRRLPEMRWMKCDCAVLAAAEGGEGDWTAEVERRATRRSVTVQSNNSPISLVLRCSTRRRLTEMRRMKCDCAASTAAAAGGEGDWTAEVEKKEVDRTVEVAVAVVATVVLGVANRVLYKLALVPLKQYPFFLAQLATFGYIVVYFSILYLRRQAGIVTKEMLSLPQLPYIAVGLLEALAAASGMAAGTMLSGASIPILSQTFLVWQLLLSAFFLGRRYNVNQLIGCFLVSMGVIITVASGSNAGPSLNDAGLFWTVLMIFSFFLQAADTIVKEVIFLNGSKQLKGRSVDLFVVNSFGSAYQALFICLLLPFLSKLWGIPFYQLPSYLKDGAACFLNVNNLSTGCGGAPLLPVLFVIVNMGFNISLLHLLKISSAVVSCLASTVSVPLSVFVFTLPLPYLGAGTALPPGFVAGVFILVLGLIFYARKPAMVPATSPTS